MPDPKKQLWPPDVALRIDEACRRFEAACKAGEVPPFDLYLGGFADEESSLLHRELSAIAREYDSGGTKSFDQSLHETPSTSSGDWSDQDYSRYLSPAQSCNELGRLAHYRVLDVLGKGGMGIVFQAEDTKLQRQVALKVMKPQIAADGEARQRFLREAQSAAAVEHDHIVTIHEVNEDRGMPYIAMQLLKGTSLDAWLKKFGTPNVSQIFRIGLHIAQGLEAAHAQGLIHRDIKPANIWLEPYDGGRVKILDFGVAASVRRSTQLTQTGEVLGTFAYMAPEQAASKKVDHRSDLYSLGVVLYRMCTGRTPFRGDAMEILNSLATKLPTPVTELNRNIPAPLAKLVDKLLDKSPDRRPSTAKEVAAVLKKMIDGENQDIGQIAAKHTMTPNAANTVTDRTSVEPQTHKDSPSLGKRRKLAAIAAIFAVLLGCLGLSALLFGPTVIRIVTNKGVLTIVTEDESVEITIKHRIKQPLILIVDPKTKRQIELTAGDYEIAVKELPAGLRFFTKKFSLHRAGNKIVDVRYAQWMPPPVPPVPPNKKNGPKNGRQPLQINPRMVLQLKEDFGEAWSPSATLSTDGALLVTQWLNKVKVWDANNCTLKNEFRGQFWHLRPALAMDPTEKILATGGADGQVKLWEIETGNELGSIPTKCRRVSMLRFAPVNKILAVGSSDGSVGLWDVTTKRAIQMIGRPISKSSVDCTLAFDPASNLFASYRLDEGRVRIRDLKTQNEIAQIRVGVSGGVLAFRDQKSILAAGFTKIGDRTVSRTEVWDIATKRRVVDFTFRDKDRNFFAASNGKIFVGLANEGNLKIWNAFTGKVEAVLHPPVPQIRGLALSPVGNTVACLSGNGTLTFWVLDTRLIGRPKAMAPVKAVPKVHTLRGHAAAVRSACFSPNGKRIVSASNDQTLKLWDAEKGEELLTMRTTDMVSSVAFSPDGKRIVSGSRDGTVKIWDAETGKEFRTMRGGRCIWSVAFSPDGKRIACGNSQGTLYIWDAHTGKELHALQGHRGLVLSVAFSPDGKRIVSGSNDSTIRVYDAQNGKEMFILQGHAASVASVAFSPNGKRIVSGSFDKSLKLWNVEKGEKLLTLRGEKSAVMCAAFSPDGKRIVSGNGDNSNPNKPGNVKLWDAENGQDIQTLDGHSSFVTAVDWSTDGRHILSSSWDQTIKIWDFAGR